MRRALLVALLVAALASPAGAADALVRVLSDRAEVHTGPGFSYRVVYAAQRGEVLPAIARSKQDHWFQVTLPDGTFGWILGDQVIPMDVDASGKDAPPSLWSRMGAALFSPSPLGDGRIGLTFSAGILGGEGMFLFRPSVLLEPHISIEGFFGETVGDQTDVLYYGAGANAYLWPASPVTPFFALGGGGASARRKADQFTICEKDSCNFSLINVGGGLLVAFKKRVTVRFDFRNYVVFDANHTQNALEYSGGLAIVF